jgi:hypothetical protein
MEAPNIIPNGPDPELAFAAIYEVEKIDDELESEKGAYMARCRAIRDRRKATIEEYRDRGLSKKDITDAIKIRRLGAKIDELKAERRDADEDPDQLDLFLSAVARGEAAHGQREAAK